MIERTLDGQVVVLRLRHGKASALDAELCAALEAELLAAAEQPVAVVLTGTGSIFSAGVDLFRVLDGGAAYLARFIPALDSLLRRLFLHPQPVVAAVNGHALAGGWVLACAADYRVLTSAPAKLGLPELQVGVPFPPMAIETVRFATPAGALSRLVLASRNVGAEEAQRLGLVDEVVAPAEVVARASAVAGELARVPPESFRLTKLQLRAPFAERAAAAVDVAAAVDAQWAAPETAAFIRAYLDRTVGRKSS